MLKKLLVSITAIFMISGGLLALPTASHAATCTDGNSIRSGIECAPADSKQNKFSVANGIQNVVNTLLFVVGIASVIVIIVSGLRFVLAGGNAQTVSSARDGILYAVIGIVVSLLAYAIVNFVLNQFS